MRFILVIWVLISLEDHATATIDYRQTYIPDHLSDRFKQEAEELRHKGQKHNWETWTAVITFLAWTQAVRSRAKRCLRG